jgi:hypothetical protein
VDAVAAGTPPPEGNLTAAPTTLALAAAHQGDGVGRGESKRARLSWLCEQLEKRGLGDAHVAVPFFAVSRTCRGTVFGRTSPPPRCTKTTQTCSFRILVYPVCSACREPCLETPRIIAFDTLKTLQKTTYSNRCCQVFQFVVSSSS